MVLGRRSRLFVVLLMITSMGALGACSTKEKTNQSQYERTATGTVKPAGMTSFMYGSHLLYDDGGRMTYALTSDEVDLSRYEGKRVQLSGNTVDGYPVDGGPPYLRVKQIEARE